MATWLFTRPVAVRQNPHTPAAPFIEEICQEIAAVADDLDDNRRALVEHWEMLLAAQTQWQQERHEISATMVTVLGQMKERGQALLASEELTAEAVEEVRRRHDDLLQLRQHLVGWQGRLRAQELGWEAERDRMLAELRNREALMEKQLQEVEELGRRWTERRKEELEALQTERHAFLQAHQESQALTRQRRQEVRDLQEEKHKLAAQALAVEQYRRQTLALARNPASAERRIDQLFRRLDKDKSDLIDAVKRESHELQAELHRLQALYTDAQKKVDDAEAQGILYANQRAEWEKLQLQTQSEQARLLLQLQTAQAQHERFEQQIRELQNEMERIARVLLEEPPPPAIVLQSAVRKKDKPNPPVDRAA